jgi:hypothetical protein
MIKPGAHTLGSIESRIAARMMLERLDDERKKNLTHVKIEFLGLRDGDQTLEFFVPKTHVNR